jgi:hypothetical protein
VIPAIPRAVLNQAATLYPFVSTSAGNVKTYGTTVSLTNIAMFPAKQNAMTSLGEMKNDLYLMFFDSATSLPVGTTFKIKDKIVYGSINLEIRKATPLPDLTTGGVHHWEINLVALG